MDCHEGWKSFNANAEKRTGEDDEISDQNPFMHLVEEVCSLYDDHLADKTEDVDKKAAAKAVDKEKADDMKAVACGKMHGPQLREKKRKGRSGFDLEIDNIAAVNEQKLSLKAEQIKLRHEERMKALEVKQASIAAKKELKEKQLAIAKEQQDNQLAMMNKWMEMMQNQSNRN
jgi:hypothetical protein